MYTNTFFDNLREGCRRSAEAIVPVVLEVVRPSSVVDVGCGRGTWLKVFAEHGVQNLRGVDGDYVDRTKLEIPVDRFYAHDLRTPLRLDRTFDLAVSLETAEHLSASVADTFVASLVRLAPTVLFSAAIPYQGGVDHQNEQWPQYWADKFAPHGYVPVDCVRADVWMNENVEYWYAQNTFVYVSGLVAERVVRDGSQILPLVHPRKYMEVVSAARG